jgi:cytidylate kinase
MARVIAIDGPAGSGKSTTAREVARRLGLPHVESGALYRAITLAALDQDAALDDGQRLVALASALPIRLELTQTGFRPTVAGADVSEAVRSDRVTRHVSAVSAIPVVREWVNAEVRTAVVQHPRGVVLDGRDIGTVVFPDAALKVFLTATPEERARRRLLQEGHEVTPAALEREITLLDQRDKADSERDIAPLRAAEDAVRLDTSQLTFDGQVEQIVTLARNSFS